MWTEALVLGLLLAPGQGAAEERARANLTAGDLRSALEVAAEVSDPVARAELRSEALYAARDFSGAVAAAERGLETRPEHLLLLWRAAAAELWLQDGARAGAFAERLRDAAESADLADEERASWVGAAEDYAARAADLREREARAREALRRSRTTVAALLALSGGALFALARRRSR